MCVRNRDRCGRAGRGILAIGGCVAGPRSSRGRSPRRRRQRRLRADGETAWTQTLSGRLGQGCRVADASVVIAFAELGRGADGLVGRGFSGRRSCRAGDSGGCTGRRPPQSGQAAATRSPDQTRCGWLKPPTGQLRRASCVRAAIWATCGRQPPALADRRIPLRADQAHIGGHLGHRRRGSGVASSFHQ